MAEYAKTVDKRRVNPRAVAFACALYAASFALLLGVSTDSASAKSQIHEFVSVPSTTQAGGHPDIYTKFVLGNRNTQEEVPCDCNDPRDILQHIPAGVSANPYVVSTCRLADLSQFRCSPDSQAGVVVLETILGRFLVPLYRTLPAKGQAALFIFQSPISFGSGVPEYLAFTSRTGSDYGLDVESLGITHISSPPSIAPVFWGVPGSPINDAARFNPKGSILESWTFCTADPIPLLINDDDATLRATCKHLSGEPADYMGSSSSLPVAPMTQNPTTCSGPLLSRLEVLSYDLERTAADAPWPATTGCDALSFGPSLAADPTTTDTDAPSGLEVVLRVPQFQDPNVPTPSALKATTVTLPEGFSINPNAADGKATCSDEQSAIGTKAEARCPEEAKVGTVSIESSALPAPIYGFLYLGEPKPGEPYRLVLTANGFGTAVKLLGTVHADPQTGRLVTSFPNQPQTPFQEIVLHFFGSERGLLATPTQCGKYPVRSNFVPWAAELSEQNQTQFFVLDHGPNGAPCPGAVRDFAPGFVAGAKNSTAGAHTSFGLRMTRDDGQQGLSGVTVDTPPGLLARLKGVPYCPETAIALTGGAGHTGVDELSFPACPAASQIGTASSGVGAGTHPLYTPGKVYLAGPYKGAPLSMLVVVPAVSGPYDLGNVAVRVALHVDPETTGLTAISDPLPRILGGIPLRLRMIQIELDRERFMLNPTNCGPSAVGALISGDQGALAGASAHFQVTNCAVLPFRPDISLRLLGNTKRRGHPALRGVVSAKPGEANIRRAVVTLPQNQLLDQGNIDNVCTRVQFAQDACPAGSVYGTASATSPLLDEPLHGPVYLRTSSHKLPDLVAALNGQIDVDLVGRIDQAQKGGLRTSFESVPDAPITRFDLTLKGGKNGLLVNERNVCQASKTVRVRLTGQNGKDLKQTPKLQTPCGSAKRGKRQR